MFFLKGVTSKSAKEGFMESTGERPGTREEMLFFMSYIGLQEGINFHALLVEWGWAGTEDEARLYLESLDIFPWED
jgi:hypothetical protein